MIEQLIFIRHGETEHNVAGIAQGWNDSALSERGRRQVDALARRLVALGADALFSSPLGRALATAQAISDATGLEIRTHEDLREMSYGSWENRSFLDIRSQHADEFRRWTTEDDFASPGGESHHAVRERLERAVRHIMGANDGQPLWSLNRSAADLPKRPIIVSHGTAIRIAATAVLGLPLSSARHFAQDNASFNLFIWRMDRWVLKTWNDTTHCPHN